MKTKPFKILGLMSGTSLDGLDMALCEFQDTASGYIFKILETTTVDYSRDMRNMLKNIIQAPATELLAAHQSYGLWLGEQALNFLHSKGLECDLIASHGHTVHHRPELGYTFQLGAGAAIANRSKIKVVCDFRTTDVSLGGQGAPLVPIGDLLLFPEYTHCLNLGGISNISEKTQQGIKAYDVGIANILLNHLSRQAGFEYDKGGQLAASGQFNASLFHALNALEYHHLDPPKSLGVEFFNLNVLPILEQSKLSTVDSLHTVSHHIAYQIKRALKGCTPEKNKILISGGGAKNDFLMNLIANYCQDRVSVVVPPSQLIDHKEALVFAFMGYLHMQEKPNCLKSVTGASADSIGGFIFKPGGL